MTQGDIAHFGGEFVPLADARVPITTHAFNYGTGCFEGIRAYWNPEHEQLYVLRLADHMQRLVNSARILKLDFEMAIPGRGEPKSRADVQAFRNRFATLITRASDAIKAGATRDQLAMQVKTDDLGWMFNAQFYGQLYDELTKK